MSPRLLLVDDSDLVRRLVVRLVEGDFEAIDQATDGASALRLLHGRLHEGGPLPTVIIADLDMKPGMCGDELALALAREARLASIPFLLMSSDPWVHEAARALRVQAFEKVGSIVGLRAVVRQMVRGGEGSGQE